MFTSGPFRCCAAAWLWLLQLVCLPALGEPPGKAPLAPAQLTEQQRARLAEGNKLFKQAHELRRKGKTSEALGIAEEALAIAREVRGPTHENVATALQLVGNLYAAREDFAAAQRIAEEFLSVLTRLYGGDHWKVTDARRALRDVQLRAKLSAEDREQLKRADRLAVEVAQLYGQGRYAAALDPARRVLAVGQRVLGEAHRGYATSLNNLAMLYQSMGEYAKAEPLFVQACDIRKKALGEAHPGYATSLNNLAMLYQSMGEYAKAEPLYVQARDITRKALGEAHPDYATSLNNLAMLYQSMGEYAKAEPLYLQACDIRKKVLGEAHPDYAASLNNLALLYKSMGEYAKAEPLYVLARKIWKKSLGEAHPDYATSLNNLARLYESMGEYAKAEPLYLQACDIRKKVLGEAHPLYAASQHNLGRLYHEMGEYAKALPLLVQARHIREKVLAQFHTDYATSLNDLAGLYQSMGEYSEAEPLYVQAVDISKKALGEAHPHYATSVENLAGLYDRMGEYAKAEPLVKEALARRVRLFEAVSAGGSEAMATACLSAIGVRYDPLLQVLRPQASRRGAQAYASVWTAQGVMIDWSAARLERVRRTPGAGAVLEKLRDTQAEFARLVLAVPKPEQREARRKRLAELNERKEALEAELGKLSFEFRRSQEARQGKPADLLGLVAGDCAVVHFVRPYVWDRPEKGKKRTGRWHYEAFVLRSPLTPDPSPARGEGSRRNGPAPGTGEGSVRVEWVHLGEAQPIDQAVAAWRASIILGKVPAGTTLPEQTLRRLLWEPIDAHLAGCKTVCIVPEDQLNFLPWAALPGRRPGTVLLEDYAISTASSAKQLLGLLKERDSPNAGLLLLGGVAYDAQPEPAAPSPTMLVAASTAGAQRSRSPAMTSPGVWRRLEGTNREVEAIGRAWRGPVSATILGGTQAGEMALRMAMPEHRYIHLATHGFFADEKFRSLAGHDQRDEQLFAAPGDRELVTSRLAGATLRNPLILSGVVLAGANLPPKTDSLGLPTGEDGILTAEEIVGLDLRGTELVVLSACDTGLGKVAGGEGVMGLARAFHLAGARNVVASLWKVDDQATAALMKLFYHKLWQEKKPPIEALREAQLAIYRHPEQIGKLAASRGPDFAKLVPLADSTAKSAPAPGQDTTRLWAAFILSGPGN